MRGDLGIAPASARIQTRFPELAARLDGAGPVGVAVSGGGDSVALLYALAEWGQRPLQVFCVDHGLNPLSPQWTQSVADHARRVGAGFTALHWRGDKPLSGLSAAARLARHKLLAEAARQKGVQVLCLAHTAGDIAEAEVMRVQGSTVGAPKIWSPSPVWPEGRGVFLYRPFLDVQRKDLRDYLRGIGAAWIEDPANDSPHSLRARTRKALAGKTIEAAPERDALVPRAQMEDLLDTDLGHLGMIVLRVDAFHALPREMRLKLLSTIAVCAGGGDKLPKRDRVEALSQNLSAGKAHSLCGARLRQIGDRIIIAREAGDIGRNRADIVPVAGGEVVWDGRFAISSPEPGEVGPSSLWRGALNDTDRAALMALPSDLRGSLPVFFATGQKDNQNKRLLTNPALSQGACDGYQVTCLVLSRLYAALGLITRESAIDGDCDGLRVNGV